MWVTAHTLPIHPKERATIWRKLNKMCRISCFYVFQIVPRNMVPDNLLRCLGEQQSPCNRCSVGGHLYERRHCKWRLTDKWRTKKLENRHMQTASRWPLRYKGKRWVERREVLWLNHFHNPQRSCARATGEERREEEDEMRKMSRTFTTRWHVFAWKKGHHCLLYSAHFRLDSCIRPVSTL